MIHILGDICRKNLSLQTFIMAVSVVIMITGVAVPRVATAAETASPSQNALLENKPWRGDFDGMAKDRVIRALVVYSKTFYFLDGGRQRGLSHDLLKQFEKFVNKKLKTKTLKVHIVFIPVRRDKLISGLVEGLGDIAVANLTITPRRKKQVAFSDPWLTGVKELVVTGPAAPSMASLDDLAGKEIHVRQSSSYYESLVQLNGSF